MTRRWHTRLPEVVRAVQGMLANAAQARAAAEAGDLARLGACLSLYWEQKKIMADGGEPAAVTIMMDALRAADLVHGLTLGGGGGGGFLVALTKSPRAMDSCRAAITAAVDPGVAAKVTYHYVRVDFEGLCVNGEPAFV